MVKYLLILLVVAFLGTTTYFTISSNIIAFNEFFRKSKTDQSIQKTTQVVDINKSQSTPTSPEMTVYQNMTDEQNLTSLESDIKELDSFDKYFDTYLNKL